MIKFIIKILLWSIFLAISPAMWFSALMTILMVGV